MKVSDDSACGSFEITDRWLQPEAAETAASPRSLSLASRPAFRDRWKHEDPAFRAPVFRLALLVALSALVGLNAAPAHAAELNSVQAMPARMPANSPLYFEANRGQVEGDVRFVARGRQCDVLIAPTEAVLILGKRETSSPAPPLEQLLPRVGGIHETLSVRFRLENANPQATASGLEELPAKANYFIGNDPAQWRIGVPLYSQVRIDQIYPGVQLVYYADESARLEYDFVLDPNARPDSISIRIEGTDSVDVDAAGNLALRAGGQEIQEHAPAIYQVVNGTRKQIKGGYHLKGKALAGIWVGEYDHTLPLVIDPILTFSAYIGGSSIDNGWGVAVDASGNVWVTGETLSPGLPTTHDALRPKYQGGNYLFGDGFVAKFANGTTNLSYLTYLGGSGEDAAFAIAVDPSGAAFVTGYTDSPNFPVFPANAYQHHIRGINLNPQGVYPIDAFVTKLNADGTIAYSTYLGGQGRDVGLGIAVDNLSRAYVTGMTESPNFPTKNALRGFYRSVLFAYPTNVNGQITYAVGNYLTNYDGSIFKGNADAFVTRINAGGTGLEYSTFLGGGNEAIGQGIAVDTNYCAYVVGMTTSASFPVTNAIAYNLRSQPNSTLVADGFISKLSPDGSNLVYSTYLGANGRDVATAVALDPLLNAYVTGFTYSTNFPVTLTNFAQWTNPTNLNSDVFVTRFNPDGSITNGGYSVVFGGRRNDQGLGIAVDANQFAYIVGFTASHTNFADIPTNAPMPAGFSATNSSLVGAASKDVFIMQLDPTGTNVFKAYLGGSGNDRANGIALGTATTINADSTPSTNVIAYIVGTTTSTKFPAVGTSKFHGSRLYPDAFVARIDFTNSAVGP